MIRRKNEETREPFLLAYDHASATDDTTVKLYKATRKISITRVHYVNPTGLAEDAANYFNLKVLQAAVVIANWSTQTGQQGTLTADTFVEFVMGSDVLIDVDEEISFFMDETGVATLPAGRVIIEGEVL